MVGFSHGVAICFYALTQVILTARPLWAYSSRLIVGVGGKNC
jgi:hypothetical protein